MDYICFVDGHTKYPSVRPLENWVNLK
jgi:hypothetical protein